MKITRLYTGDDGETHIEELDLASHPELTSPLAATSVTFSSSEPGDFRDWHPGPRRQFVITLSGEAEIGLGDGSFHRFRPGHVTLVEDLTGRGHTRRIVSDEPRVAAIIRLA